MRKLDHGKRRAGETVMQGKQSWNWIKENQEIRNPNRDIGGESRPLESMAVVGLLFYCISVWFGSCNGNAINESYFDSLSFCVLAMS